MKALMQYIKNFILVAALVGTVAPCVGWSALTNAYRKLVYWLPSKRQQEKEKQNKATYAEPLKRSQVPKELLLNEWESQGGKWRKWLHTRQHAEQNVFISLMRDLTQAELEISQSKNDQERSKKADVLSGISLDFDLVLRYVHCSPPSLKDNLQADTFKALLNERYNITEAVIKSMHSQYMDLKEKPLQRKLNIKKTLDIHKGRLPKLSQMKDNLLSQ